MHAVDETDTVCVVASVKPWLPRAELSLKAFGEMGLNIYSISDVTDSILISLD